MGGNENFKINRQVSQFWILLIQKLFLEFGGKIIFELIYIYVYIPDHRCFIQEMFNADYGMFILDSESQSFWFNPTSYESDAQFTLVGIILGGLSRKLLVSLLFIFLF